MYTNMIKINVQKSYTNGIPYNTPSMKTKTIKKMQSKTADFTLVPPPGKLYKTYMWPLILAHLLHYVKT